MRIKVAIFKLTLLLSLFVNQIGLAQENQNTGPPKISPQAAAYLDQALAIMQNNSINRTRINWVELRKMVFQRAGAAQTTKDTYEALRFALRELKDNHSFLILPPTSGNTSPASALNKPVPKGEIVDGRYAYILLPGFSGSAEEAKQFSTTLLEIVRKLDGQNPCGWIIDLQQNPGGNMWPMLAGIGPVVGEGLLGSFVSPDGIKVSWSYIDGKIKLGNSVAAVTGETVYRLKNLSAPVAVLTGKQTASSGEAVVTSFRGRPNTRSFGKGTYGLSTANRPFPLSDGARLNLTVSVFADRTGREYGGVIEPDEVVDSATEYVVMKAAIGWLSSQEGCAPERRNN